MRGNSGNSGFSKGEKIKFYLHHQRHLVQKLLISHLGMGEDDGSIHRHEGYHVPHDFSILLFFLLGFRGKEVFEAFSDFVHYKSNK